MLPDVNLHNIGSAFVLPLVASFAWHLAALGVARLRVPVVTRP